MEDRKTRRETRGWLFLLASACACLQHYCSSYKKEKKTTKIPHCERWWEPPTKTTKMEIYSLSPLVVYVHTHHWKANCTGNSFVHYKCNIVLLDMTVFIFCVRLCVWSGVFPKSIPTLCQKKKKKKQRIPQRDFLSVRVKCLTLWAGQQWPKSYSLRQYVGYITCEKS